MHVMHVCVCVTGAPQCGCSLVWKLGEGLLGGVRALRGPRLDPLAWPAGGAHLLTALGLATLGLAARQNSVRAVMV